MYAYTANKQQNYDATEFEKKKKNRQTVGTLQHTFDNIHKIADRDYDIDLSTIKIKFNIAKRRLRHQHW